MFVGCFRLLCKTMLVDRWPPLIYLENFASDPMRIIPSLIKILRKKMPWGKSEHLPIMMGVRGMPNPRGTRERQGRTDKKRETTWCNWCKVQPWLPHQFHFHMHPLRIPTSTQCPMPSGMGYTLICGLCST